MTPGFFLIAFFGGGATEKNDLFVIRTFASDVLESSHEGAEI